MRTQTLTLFPKGNQRERQASAGPKGPWTTDQTSSFPQTIDLVTTKSDIVRLPYRRLIRERRNASTYPYISTIRQAAIKSVATGKGWHLTNSVNLWTEDQFWGLYPGMFAFTTPPGDADFNPYRAVARARFIKALKQKRAEFSGLTFLGELRETIGFVRKPAIRVIQGLDRYLQQAARARRGINAGLSFTRRVAAWEKILSNLWLELSFGVSPLLADMRSLGQALGRYGEVRTSSVVRGQHSEKLDLHFSNPPIQVSASMQVQLHDAINRKIGCTVYGALKGQAEIPHGVSKMLDLLGFRWENFIPTAYELVPFSWLADYYSNLGQIIEASTTDTSELAWHNETTWSRDESLLWQKLTPRPGTGRSVTALGDDTWGEVYARLFHTRRDSGVSLVPPLQTNLPGSISQLANMLAVVIQLAHGLGVKNRNL